MHYLINKINNFCMLILGHLQKKNLLSVFIPKFDLMPENTLIIITITF